MTSARIRRIAVALWIVLGIALWNGIFEMMVIRGVKEYLFRAALADAGRGPRIPIPEVMDPMIFNATWVATLWTAVILLAAFSTIRAFDSPRTVEQIPNPQSSNRQSINRQSPNRQSQSSIPNQSPIRNP